MLETYDGNSEYIPKIDKIVAEELNKLGLKQKNIVHYQNTAWITELKGDTFQTEWMDYGGYYADKTSLNMIIPVQYYNEMCGKNVELSDNEALIYTPNEKKYGKDTVLVGEDTFQIAGEPETVPMYEKGQYFPAETYLLFVKDEGVIEKLRQKYGGGTDHLL